MLMTKMIVARYVTNQHQPHTIFDGYCFFFSVRVCLFGFALFYANSLLSPSVRMCF